MRRAGAEDHGGEWAFPGGKLRPGESLEDCVWRETLEEVGYRLGDPGVRLMRRCKDGVDATTFMCDVPAEFSPALNSEHDSWQWLKPEDVVKAGKAQAATQAAADDADPDAQFLVDLEGPA